VGLVGRIKLCIESQTFSHFVSPPLSCPTLDTEKQAMSCVSGSYSLVQGDTPSAFCEFYRFMFYICIMIHTYMNTNDFFVRVCVCVCVGACVGVCVCVCVCVYVCVSQGVRV